MISNKQYIKAQQIIRDYELQQKEKGTPVYNGKRGDYLTYVGGSKSQYLAIGTMYRLTTSPWGSPRGDLVSIINDKGRRFVTKKKYFISINGLI
jgi:hypothetical protein